MTSFSDVKIDPNELINGCSAVEIFSGSEQLGLTFDDLIALPDQIDFGVHEVRNEFFNIIIIIIITKYYTIYIF